MSSFEFKPIEAPSSQSRKPTPNELQHNPNIFSTSGLENASDHLTGSPAEQVACAREIMGESLVLGPEAVGEAFRIELQPEDIPPIRFSRHELEQAARLGLLLILRTDKDVAGAPLTINHIVEIFAKHPGNAAAKLLNVNAAGSRSETRDESDDSLETIPDSIIATAHYVQAEFCTKDTPVATWVLASETEIEGSRGQDYLSQTERIVDYLRDEIFRGMDIPVNYKEAMSDFERRKEDISRLMDSADYANRYEASRQLADLGITRLTRPSAVEAIYDMALTFTVRGKRLLERNWSWTRSLTNDGDLVFVGDFMIEKQQPLSSSRKYEELQNGADMGACTGERGGSGLCAFISRRA